MVMVYRTQLFFIIFFSCSVAASDANLTLTCFKPTLTTTKQQLSTSTSTQQPSSTTSTHQPTSTTQWTSSTTTLPSTTNTTNGLVVTDTAVITYGIGIGCFTGGIIVGVVCLLGIIRFRRSRKEEKNIYSTTFRNEQELHTYAEAGNTENPENRTKNAYIGPQVPHESVYENISK
ncbi:hypothetical protein LOTGIDRAFT_169916 [Lottia gigantea]|uniref:Uncharacterized protein n=1 Tax=Lottia gigantea TaxID=225164 RepID=V3ZP17_LOTGI|nr:hypothetical protein LOTGIDRAFT_169916 [Lottia gigantea]ESO82596.1 hypothetical protein LOTGIDRAFT_169916 [Lottia gigantea]